VKNTYWSMRLDALIAADDLDGAREAARTWSEFSVRTPEPYRRLALACAARGLDDEAEALFQMALSLADDEPRTLLDYAEVLRTQERHAEAESILARVEPANPSQAERLTNLRLWRKQAAASVAAKPAAPKRLIQVGESKPGPVQSAAPDGSPRPLGRLQRA